MYKVTFVGLVCFLKQPDSGRLALMPDGRNLDGIDAHVPRLIVGQSRVTGGSGWPLEELASGIFNLPPCTIELEGTEDGAVQLDTSEHEGRVPSLQGIDPAFQIDPATARTVGRVPIRRGRLKAYRYPGSFSLDPDVAVVSELRVPHDGPITVTIRPDDGSAAKTISLEASTGIVIANASRPSFPASVNELSHFMIYAQLAATPVSLAGAHLNSIGLPRLFTTHRYFTTPGGIGLHAECGNTGCCP
jgi:hypothetical protein